MSGKNPKEFVHKTAYSVQLPHFAGHSLLDYADSPVRICSDLNRNDKK